MTSCCLLHLKFASKNLETALELPAQKKSTKPPWNRHQISSNIIKHHQISMNLYTSPWNPPENPMKSPTSVSNLFFPRHCFGTVHLAPPVSFDGRARPRARRDGPASLAQNTWIFLVIYGYKTWPIPMDLHLMFHNFPSVHLFLNDWFCGYCHARCEPWCWNLLTYMKYPQKCPVL